MPVDTLIVTAPQLGPNTVCYLYLSEDDASTAVWKVTMDQEIGGNSPEDPVKEFASVVTPHLTTAPAGATPGKRLIACIKSGGVFRLRFLATLSSGADTVATFKTAFGVVSQEAPVVWVDGTVAPIPGGGVPGPPGTASGPIHYLWVDSTNGDDATGTRGDIGKPYKTIGAAFADATTNDTLLISPGTYAEEVAWDPDAGKRYVSFVGEGGLVTWSNVTPGNACLSAAPSLSADNALYQGAYFENIAFLGQTNLDTCVVLNGAADDNVLFMSKGVQFQSCQLHGYDLSLCNDILVNACDTAIISNVYNLGPNGSVRINGGRLGDLNIRDNSAAGNNPANPGVVSIYGGASLKKLSLIGTPSLDVAKGVTILTNIDASGLSSTFDGTIDKMPQIQMFGEVSNPLFGGSAGMTLAMPLPQGGQGDSSFYRFAGSQWNGGSVTVSQIADPTRFNVDLREANFVEATFRANNCDADLRGAQIPQASVTFVGTAAIDRSQWMISGDAVAGGASLSYAAAPYPTGKAPNSAAVSWVGAIATTGVTISTPPSETAIGLDCTAPGPQAVFVTLFRI
jgi:hypothetical protein